MKKNVWILGGLFFLLFLAFLSPAAAQCAMCKGAAQTGLDPEHAGKSLNLGIIMMFGMPYLIVGFIAFVWWKNRKTEQDADDETNLERALNEVA